MNKKMSLAVIGAALICAASLSIADSVMAHTPLYIIRMEHASSKMNFLPTTVNQFMYTTEKGYTVECNAAGYKSVLPLSTSPASTCDPTCNDTCEDTCEWTCYQTCGNTCASTCPSTCSTCVSTCWHTCPSTCSTCPITCWNTCGPTCDESCGGTCPRECP